MNNDIEDKKKDIQEKPKEKKGLFASFGKKKKNIENPPPQDDGLDEGLNLIPVPTKEEVEKEEKKAVLNVGSAFSLLTLVLVSVFVISFNIMSKTELNKNKEALYEYETKMKRMSQEIIDNEEIMDRIFLYKNIQEKTFSPKEVIQYIEDIADKSGGIYIRTYEIQDNLAFEFTGQSQDLEKISKFWYLLCNDSSISTVNLSSVSKGENGATFAFDGQFIYEDFVNTIKDESN